MSGGVISKAGVGRGATRNQTVVVGMSGGVDSCATALILKDRGYRVVGVTLKVWKEEDHPDKRWQERSCCKVGVARYVAGRLGIEHHVVDVQPEFRSAVIEDFIGGYLAGETPNPCVRCNEQIKFGRLFEIAQELGGDFLATGHYVRLERQVDTGEYFLKRAVDGLKDQSYFLYRIRPEILPHLLFPLGTLRKPDIWKRVGSLDLPAEEMQESQEICFVTQQDYRQFLSIEAPEAARPGRIVTTAGEEVGKHGGVAGYTIGQRRGLGISAAHPLYVTDIRPESNTVVVGPESDLLCQELVAEDLNLFMALPMGEPRDLEVKVRYRSPLTSARILSEGAGRLRVAFKTPQRAVTPGQSVVFYQGERLIGGGVIRSTSARPGPLGRASQTGDGLLDIPATVC